MRFRRAASSRSHGRSQRRRPTTRPASRRNRRAVRHHGRRGQADEPVLRPAFLQSTDVRRIDRRFPTVRPGVRQIVAYDVHSVGRRGVAARAACSGREHERDDEGDRMSARTNFTRTSCAVSEAESPAHDSREHVLGQTDCAAPASRTAHAVRAGTRSSTQPTGAFGSVRGCGSGAEAEA